MAEAKQAEGQVAAEDLRHLYKGENMFVIASTATDDMPTELADDPSFAAPLWMCEVVEEDPEDGTDQRDVDVFWLACGPSKHGRMAGNW